MSFARPSPWPLIDLRPLPHFHSAELPAIDLFDSGPSTAADKLSAPSLKTLTLLLDMHFERPGSKTEKLRFGPAEKEWMSDFAASLDARCPAHALARIHVDFRPSPAGYEGYLQECRRWPWDELNAAVLALAECGIEMSYHDPKVMSEEWHESLRRAVPVWARKGKAGEGGDG